MHAANNIIDKVNGFFFKVGTPSVSVGVSESTALTNALNFVNAKKYGWEDSSAQSLYRQQQKDSSATLYPKGKLLIFYDDSITHAYRLVYQFPVYAVQPLIDCNVYVDAISGSVIYRENLIEDANTPGTATTLYSGVQNIVMDSYNTPLEYRLMETRPGPYGSAQIYTRDMHNTGTYGAWQEFNNATVNWNTPDGSLDVQLGTERVFDYWNNVRHRNSYDGSGGSLIGYVHANLVAMGQPNNDNAFWSSTMQVMTYGDGTFHFHQVTSLDVIAHEIGHGVCQKTANLQGATGNWEPDALNEGLSDIWGAVIEDWAALPNKQTWEIGENIMADGYPCLRSLQNPRTGGDPLVSNTGGYPDTYHGQFWDNNTHPDPHINSTVLSHWFYLLSIGGTGWNNGQTSNAPTGSGYQWNVNSIGITEAASIVWEAESNHLIQSSTNYSAIRTAMLSAAQNLYGIGSCEEIAVTNAWYAVGVGAAYSGNAGLSISGDALFCTTSNPYTIPNLPAGSTVSWSTTPTGIATPGTYNLTQTTLTKSANGVIILTATISNICGGPITLTKSNIVVGTPSIPNITALRAGGTCYYDAAVTLSLPSTTVEFSFNSTTWFAGIQNGNVFRSGNAEFLGPTYQMVYARTSNVCGKGPVFSRNLYIPAPPQPCAYVANRTSVAKDSSNVSKTSMDAINESNIRVYPNPADKTLIIELPVLSGNTQVNIYNNEGRLMLSQKLYNKTNKVDISDFKAGIYLIRVQSDDGKVSTVKIVKE